MVVDELLGKGLDVNVRRLTELHAAQLNLSHVHDGDVMREFAVALHICGGTARADAASARQALF